MAIIYGKAISIGYSSSKSNGGGLYSIWLTIPAVATSVTFTAVKGDVSVPSTYISTIGAAKITLPETGYEGDWIITGTVGGKTASKTVTVKSGTVDYFIDFRNDFIPLSGELKVGNLVTFDNKSWRVVHQEGTHWYLASENIVSKTVFGPNTSYSGSTLARVANDYQTQQLSATALEYCVDVTVEGVTNKVFIPTYTQTTGGFNYYTSSTNRICQYNGSNSYWWISSPNSGTNYNYAVDNAGLFGSVSHGDSYGFRPHICIKYYPIGFDFTYTGTCNIRKDGVVEFLTSGDFIPNETINIDAFLVGGGCAGNGGGNSGAASGGGSGYTKTLTKILLQQGISYPISIGAGGTYSTTSTYFGSAGGDTTAFGTTVKGGQPSTNTGTGGNGGSGGGGTTTQGGSNGSDGISSGAYIGGKGQGTTTREFGEYTGKLYAGGGSGGISDNTTTGTAGGDGGGGMGGTYAVNGHDGEANTGSGGGGRGSNKNLHAGSGGSGIVCIRKSKPQSTDIPLTGDLAIGNTITFDDKSFVVVHNEGTKWYLAKEYITDQTIFNSSKSSVYNGSTLASMCNTYLTQFSDNAKNYMVDVTVNNVTNKAFIPSYEQVNGGFSWYNSNANRTVKRDTDKVNMSWWTSSAYSNNTLYAIEGGSSLSTGSILTKTYDSTLGVRPHICIDTSLSGSTTEDNVTLAGTWMFNEPLSAPESLINEYINFTGKEMVTSTPRNFTGARISTTQFDATPEGVLPIVVYKFAEKTWVNKYKYLTFPAGATASDEFIAWLKTNATKQS